jgi:hypothetical protein
MGMETFQLRCPANCLKDRDSRKRVGASGKGLLLYNTVGKSVLTRFDIVWDGRVRETSSLDVDLLNSPFLSHALVEQGH